MLQILKRAKWTCEFYSSLPPFPLSKQASRPLDIDPLSTSDTDEKSPEHDTANKPDAGAPRKTSNTNLQIFQSALGIPPPADRPGLTILLYF